MGSWNYRESIRRSWAAGHPTVPTKPCARCRGEATHWIAYDYHSGKARTVTTGYRPICLTCATPYCDRQNAKAARASEKAKKSKKPNLEQALNQAIAAVRYRNPA